MASVLVVEDEAQIRALLVDICTSHGVTVVTAANGKEGLECARKQQFDCIFTDFNMPKMSGIELIRELQQEKSTSKIILMSGTIRETELDSSDLQGIQFLTKPFQVNAIIKIIQSL